MDGCLGFSGTEQRHNQQHINTEGAFVVYKTSDGARNACLQTDSPYIIRTASCVLVTTTNLCCRSLMEITAEAKL